MPGAGPLTAKFTSLLTVGDSVNLKPDGINPYRMVGIPDGLGAYDNGNGTITVLMTHEISPTAANPGIVRAHGAAGAFVSQWVIQKSNLQVLSGQDLVQTQKLWDIPTSSFVTATSAFNACARPICRPCRRSTTVIPAWVTTAVSPWAARKAAPPAAHSRIS